MDLLYVVQGNKYVVNLTLKRKEGTNGLVKMVNR